MPHVAVRNGSRYDLTLPLVTVGRHSTNIISIIDDRISRQHLELRAADNGYRLVDLGSGNGTLVNGIPVTECVLQPGDQITIGDTVLVYSYDQSESTRFQSGIVRTVPASDGPQLLANLGTLYEASAAISRSRDIDELLGQLLDLAMRATRADQGGVLLADADSAEPLPRAALPADFKFSRTIIDYVRREQQGVLAADAAADERFAGGESIITHGLREVIAAPLGGREGVLGVLVLETLGSAGQPKFTADHLNLAVALAHQAALAVEAARHYDALLNAERLAAVGQTIAGLSHHIKNIMQGVRFGGDMVRAGLGGDDTPLVAKGWSLVEKNQTRIESLIRDMLSYSKAREPEKTPTDLAAVVRDVQEMLRGRLQESNISFENNLTEFRVECDAEAMHAAILNIVSNAIDALDGVESPRIRIHGERDGARALLFIEDNGSGVPPEQREAIFEPFVSTKGSRGTGLGLPVSRKILREHGGDLTVGDAPSGGAAFELRLPRIRGNDDHGDSKSVRPATVRP